MVVVVVLVVGAGGGGGGGGGKRREEGNATEITTVWRIGTKYNGRHGNTTTSNDI